MDWKITPPANGKVATVVLMVIMVLASIALISAYMVEVKDSSNEGEAAEKIEYRYTFEANATGNGNITIRIPLPVKGNGTVSDIARGLKLDNDSASWCIIETPHGMAYEINFTGHVGGEIIGNSLSNITVFNDIPDLYLSMDTAPEKTGELHNPGSNTKFWIYSSNDSHNESNLSFLLRFDYKYSKPHGKVAYELVRSWNMNDTITQNDWSQITARKNTSMS